MSTQALAMDDTDHSRPEQKAAAVHERQRQLTGEEMIMHLERDQLVAETSRRLAPAALGARARAGLWVLRVFVSILAVMVIYSFIHQL